MDDQVLKELVLRLEDRTEAYLGKINATLGRIDQTLTSQHGQLVEHIRRTQLLEESMVHIRQDQDEIKIHVVKVQAISWFIVKVTAFIIVVVPIIIATHEFLKAHYQ